MNSTFNYLTVDPPIAGQRIALVSFAEPPFDLLSKRELFCMEQYLKFLVRHKLITVNPALENLDTLNEIIKEQYQKEVDEKGLVVDEKFDFGNPELKLIGDELWRTYGEFKFNNDTFIKQRCAEMYPNVSFERGWKFRGAFDSLEQAKEQAEMLAKLDSRFNVYAGEQGKWVPFNADASKIQDQKTRDTRMNELIEGYIKNQEENREFKERLREEQIKKMTEDTRAKKEKLAAERENLQAEEIAVPSDDEHDFKSLLTKTELVTDDLIGGC